MKGINNKLSALVERVDHLLELGNKTHSSKPTNGTYVVPRLFQEFRSSTLSFIKNTYGEKHPYYTDFFNKVSDTWPACTSRGIGILNGIKSEFENGWLISFKDIVSAEIFSDFLEMSKYLLDEGYKDAAAVMLGSTLEEHLRQLCNNHGVETQFLKGEDNINKKADVLNADLKKADVYGALEQKQVTAWLGIRNSAAHGKYDEYKIDQVQYMYLGVLNFITNIK